MLDHTFTAPGTVRSLGALIGAIGTDAFADRVLVFLDEMAGVTHYSIHIAAEDGEVTCCLAAGPEDAADPAAPQVVLRERIGDHAMTLTCKTGSRGFNRALQADLQVCAPLLLSAVQRHLNLATAEPAHEATRQPRATVETIIEQVKRDLLADGEVSQREAEVCAYIAAGYTIGAISLNLGITQNTAATHRKRAYSKLRISSQNELFARYFGLGQPSLRSAA